jgi:hypothetical protein
VGEDTGDGSNALGFVGRQQNRVVTDLGPVGGGPQKGVNVPIPALDLQEGLPKALGHIRVYLAEIGSLPDVLTVATRTPIPTPSASEGSCRLAFGSAPGADSFGSPA